jgi:hypothetical protein
MGVELTFGVADFRTLARDVDGTFDVVISCDNSLPHLLTDDDLHAAARNIHANSTRRLAACQHPGHDNPDGKAGIDPVASMARAERYISFRCGIGKTARRFTP